MHNCSAGSGIKQQYWEWEHKVRLIDSNSSFGLTCRSPGELKHYPVILCATGVRLVQATEVLAAGRQCVCCCVFVLGAGRQRVCYCVFVLGAGRQRVCYCVLLCVCVRCWEAVCVLLCVIVCLC